MKLSSDQPPQPEDTSAPEQGQTLVDHLTELRDRLLKAILAIVVVFLVLFPFSSDIYAIVSEPLRLLLPDGTSMIATDVASPFFAPFKLTLIVAVLFAMPFILFQAWAFISPGLYQQEKTFAVPLLASSIILFYLGILFAYYVVFPLIFGFFSAIVPEGVAYTPDISRFLDMVIKLFFAFGLAFEIPIATMLLIRSGISTAEQLASKRPYVIVGCFVLGMLLTPPDIISQSLLALPMWALFELGLVLSRFMKPNAS